MIMTETRVSSSIHCMAVRCAYSVSLLAAVCRELLTQVVFFVVLQVTATMLWKGSTTSFIEAAGIGATACLVSGVTAVTLIATLIAAEQILFVLPLRSLMTASKMDAGGFEWHLKASISRPTLALWILNGVASLELLHITLTQRLMHFPSVGKLVFGPGFLRAVLYLGSWLGSHRWWSLACAILGAFTCAGACRLACRRRQLRRSVADSMEANGASAKSELTAPTDFAAALPTRMSFALFAVLMGLLGAGTFTHPGYFNLACRANLVVRLAKYTASATGVTSDVRRSKRPLQAAGESATSAAPTRSLTTNMLWDDLLEAHPPFETARIVDRQLPRVAAVPRSPQQLAPSVSKYVMFILESARTDSNLPVFSESWDSSSAAAGAATASAQRLRLEAYTPYANTLKSAVSFLCGRVARPDFVFTDFDDLVANEVAAAAAGAHDRRQFLAGQRQAAVGSMEQNTCLPHLLRKYRGMRTALLSDGAHANHMLSDGVMHAIGFDAVVGRESLLQLEAGDGNSIANISMADEGALHHRLTDMIAKELDAKENSFTLVFLSGSHAKWHGGNRAKYDAAQRQQSELIANVLRHVDRTGRSTSAKFMAMGDHGEMFGEHGETHGHGTCVFEEAVRVPVWFFGGGWGATFFAGFGGKGRKQLPRLTSTLDVPATILADADLTVELDDENVVGLPLQEHSAGHRYLVTRSVIDESVRAVVFRADSDAQQWKFIEDWQHFPDDEFVAVNLLRSEPSGEKDAAAATAAIAAAADPSEIRPSLSHRLLYEELVFPTTTRQLRERFLLATSDVKVGHYELSNCGTKAARATYNPMCSGASGCTVRQDNPNAPVYRRASSNDYLLERVVRGGKRMWILAYYPPSNMPVRVLYNNVRFADQVYPPELGWEVALGQAPVCSVKAHVSVDLSSATAELAENLALVLAREREVANESGTYKEFAAVDGVVCVDSDEANGAVRCEFSANAVGGNSSSQGRAILRQAADALNARQAGLMSFADWQTIRIEVSGSKIVVSACVGCAKAGTPADKTAEDLAKLAAQAETTKKDPGTDSNFGGRDVSGASMAQSCWRIAVGAAIGLGASATLLM